MGYLHYVAFISDNAFGVSVKLLLADLGVPGNGLQQCQLSRQPRVHGLLSLPPGALCLDRWIPQGNLGNSGRPLGLMVVSYASVALALQLACSSQQVHLLNVYGACAEA